MKNVQIYFNEEVKDIVFNSEQQTEWQKLAKELGLNNQLELSDEDKSVVPYQWMNTNLINICSTLCPTQVLVENYDKEPLPLEVMQQLAFVKRENHFEHVEVWYNDKSPDPFLVGTKCGFYTYTEGNWDGRSETFKTRKEAEKVAHKDSSVYTTNDKKYLIARWGDEKKSFKQLGKDASDRLNVEIVAKLKTDIENLKAKLATSSENIALYLAGEKTRHELDNVR